MYRCSKCRQSIKELDEIFVRCPYCGNRVLFKERPPVAKEVSSD
jgi:DNA-directed RNA polymerase subunit RPC12/RpoP